MNKNKDLEKLHKLYVNLQAADKKHNFILAASSLQEFYGIQEDFWSKLNVYLGSIEQDMEDLKNNYADNLKYSDYITSQLMAKDIPTERDGNNILVGPIEVSVHVDEYYLLLSIGRKKQRISDLEPMTVVRLIEGLYRKLNRSFNSKLFFRQLLKAYDYLNTIKYSTKDVKYGFNISLKSVFDLFALSPMATGYKIDNFLWDLGRLISTGTVYDNYRLELGYTRDVGKMYLIKALNGEERKASTLIIHKEG